MIKFIIIFLFFCSTASAFDLPWVNIVDYGAVDGQDSTEAINTAIQVANGEVAVYIPQGTYLINAVNDNANFPTTGGLILIDNTKLLLAPGAVLKAISNDSYKYNVLLIRKVKNIRIVSGTIEGDRATHSYTGLPTFAPTHEWGYGAFIAGDDVVFDGVTFKGFTGDAAIVSGVSNLLDPEHYMSRNVRFVNCTFDGNRRNHISIVDGDNIRVTNNNFINAGINDGIHDGTAPRYGIDIEGEGSATVDYRIPTNVIVDGNNFSGNLGGSVCNYKGHIVTITNNNADNTIGYGYGTETVIAGNNITEKPGANYLYGLNGLGVSTTTTENHVMITANNIKGFNTALDLRGKNILASQNNITSARQYGALVYNGTNIDLDTNKITDTPTGIYVANYNTSAVGVYRNKVYNASIQAFRFEGRDVLAQENVSRYSKAGFRVNGGSAILNRNTVMNSGYPAQSYAFNVGAGTANIFDSLILGQTNYSFLVNTPNKVNIINNKYTGSVLFTNRSTVFQNNTLLQ